MKKILLLLSIVVLTAFCSVCFPCGPIPPSTAVLRVIPNPINAYVIADHNAYAIKGKPVLLDGSLSVAGTGSIIRYQWDFNDNNKYDYAESKAVHPDGTFDGRTWHKFENTGKYTVKLMVTDSAGYSDTETADVNVSEDSDIDGLPNAWEMRYFGNLNQTGSGNYDSGTGDTFTNMQEYLHGTNPASFTSSIPSGTIVAHGGATPIQSAIDGSIDGDTIIVLPGTYNENIYFSKPNRTLRSIDPNNWELVGNTIIKAGNEERSTVNIFEQGATISNTTVLEGFTITGAEAYAKGIECDGTSPEIRKCIIKENGIWSPDEEFPPGEGGGILLYESSAIIKNCFIIHNTCYASYETYGRGGGISITGGSPQISNCVFYENGAEEGGALSLYGGSLTMRNCTIVGNFAYGYGGGIRNINGTVNIYNTVLWGNNAWYGDDQISNNGGTINKTKCWIQGEQGNENNPCFAKINFPAGKDGIYGTRDDGLRLRISGTSTWTGSPCVDAGYGTDAPSADIIGQARVDIPNKSGGSGNPSYVDIGAYELNRIWFVTPNGSGSGQSWQTPSSLQNALYPYHASAGNEIWAAEGTYKPTTGSDRTISFNLPSSISVHGGFAGTETDFADRNYSTHKTILSGDIGTQNVATDNSYHVVKAIDKTGVLLDGFTVQDGYCSGGPGGGIYAASASMSIRNCVISDNYAGYGGGIGNGDADNWLPSSMQIANCVLANNTAGTGGAMHFNSYSLLAEIVNCTIVGNSASSNGGGIANGSPVIIENSIIWGNLIGVNPSNIYNINAAPMISYSDIEGCGGSPPGGTWNTAFGNDVGKNIALDPQFVNSGDFDGVDNVLGTADDGLRLDDDPLSPCIDEGNNLFIHEASDIAGNKRIRYGAVDMGAYEFFTGGAPVHFSGVWVADGRPFGLDPSSIAFEDDDYSDILEPDYYPDADQALNDIRYSLYGSSTLDSIAIHQGTRVRIWTGTNYTGDLVLDVSGPAIIYNAYWGPNYENDPRYIPVMTADFSETGHSDLQAEFPPSVRYWSDDTNVHPEGDGRMYYYIDDVVFFIWEVGSIKIDAEP
jgi:hypothetical protein